MLNTGAVQALTKRKASLLPVGVTAVEGNFSRGEVIEVRDGSGLVIGRGLANYDSAALWNGSAKQDMFQLMARNEQSDKQEAGGFYVRRLS